jgi:hypothetical protein
VQGKSGILPSRDPDSLKKVAVCDQIRLPSCREVAVIQARSRLSSKQKFASLWESSKLPHKWNQIKLSRYGVFSTQKIYSSLNALLFFHGLLIALVGI